MTRVNKTSAKKLEACARARAKRNADPDKLAQHQAYMRSYRQANKDKLNAQSSDRYHGNPEGRLRYRLRRIGVKATPELIQQLLAHNGLCDLCGAAGDGRWKELSIDHCHQTHTFRGMLCSSCNRGLGFFKDDLALLERATSYLIQHRKLLEI